MNARRTVAVLGTGVIGASWAALFLSNGLKVHVFDPSPTAETDLRQYIETAWPTLTRLGHSDNADASAVTMCPTAPDAVAGATFIQESVPERIAVKHALYREIEPHLEPNAILATSASGLMLSELAHGLKAPEKLVLGHPFNPPHLIPLVEVMGDEEVAARAEAFYQSLGKTTIRVHREVPGHVANRLQAALWREAIHLINQGVASVEDVDKAVSAGPGLRWATHGPTTLFHLGAGAGGLREFCNRYADSFERWWDDLGAPRLDPPTIERLGDGIDALATNRTELAHQRDRQIVEMLIHRHPAPREVN